MANDTQQGKLVAALQKTRMSMGKNPAEGTATIGTGEVGTGKLGVTGATTSAQPQSVPTNGASAAKAAATGQATSKTSAASDAQRWNNLVDKGWTYKGWSPSGNAIWTDPSGNTVQYKGAMESVRAWQQGGGYSASSGTGGTSAASDGGGAGSVGDYMGSVDPETGEATAPDIGGYGQQQLDKLEGLAQEEISQAKGSLGEAEEAISGREADTETQLAEGRARLDETVQATDDIAAQAKEDAAKLPEQVQNSLEGIADKYKETTDVDIDRIEGIGREAAAAALEGKNAAAQAAVSAQQQAMREAEAKINADPDIPAGKKSAMLAQLRVSGSMKIAETIGANIKDFTQMQTGALTATMNAVASASTARNQSLAAMGTAEMNAVSSAYEKASDISAGFDQMRINARANADSTRFNYDQLTANYRDAKDGTSLALLDAENSVSQLGYDFALNHYSIGRAILGDDFATKLQAGGYNNLLEAAADGQDWAKSATMAQLLMEMIPGGGGALAGVLALLGGLF